MPTYWREIAVGLLLLAFGAEVLVRGAVGLARRFGVSELVIGLTLVGFGTSTPELLASVRAALAGSPGIAVGGVVGSNIANIFLILGLSVVVAPIAVARRGYWRDAGALFGSSLALISVSKTGEFSREAGLWFLVILALYIFAAWIGEREAEEVRGAQAEVTARPPRSPTLLLAGLVAVGIGLLVYGADQLVDGSIDLAAGLGVSETVVGLTVVAIGTSLPELFTSIVAAFRGNGALAYGNVVGSCVYNVFGILGATSVISPVPAPPDLFVDNMVLMGATLALIMFAFTGGRLDRREGGLFLAAYAAFIGFLVLKSKL